MVAPPAAQDHLVYRTLTGHSRAPERGLRTAITFVYATSPRTRDCEDADYIFGHSVQFLDFYMTIFSAYSSRVFVQYVDTHDKCKSAGASGISVGKEASINDVIPTLEASTGADTGAFPLKQI